MNDRPLRRSLATLLALAAAAPAAEPPRVEMLPHPSIHRMANVARAVVEGTVGRGGVVTVTRRLFVQDGARVADRITVRGLADMPLVTGLAALGGQKAVAPDSALLFLGDNPDGDEWVALHHHGAAARGVLWFVGADVYGYAQSMNPGAYTLGAWRFGEGAQGVGDATPEAVRGLVAGGLAARAKWRAALAIEDPAERAGALARWLSPATSPDGAHFRERLWPDVMQAFDSVAAHAGPVLARVVKTERDPEVVHYAADVIGRLGPAGRGAAPGVVARLRDPGDAKPIFLVRALRSTADPRSANVLRDLLATDDLFLLGEVARALRACGGADEELVRVLKRRMPAHIDDRPTLGATAGLLELLHDLDPQGAERIVVERYLDCGQLMMQRPWLRRLRDANDRRGR